MSKFGRFIAGANHPLETFEGYYRRERKAPVLLGQG